MVVNFVSSFFISKINFISVDDDYKVFSVDMWSKLWFVFFVKN